MSEARSDSAALGVFSRGLANVPHLQSFVDQPIVLYPSARDPRIRAAAGWGRKASGERAARYAASRGIPCWRLEDGFLRSVGLGVQGAAPLSLIVDDIGIYFDATRPSRLEEQLNRAELAPGVMARAERLREALTTCNLGKYNHAPDAPPNLIVSRKRLRVLLIDQTSHDQSILHGLASAASFRAMFDAARRENPDADLFIKSHPDVIAGKKRSALAFAREVPGVVWIAQPVSAMSLLRQVDRVYTVSSQMGFEALLLDKPVSCFGMPFYAGWGATDDRVPCARRTSRRNILEILAAAYILYPRYIDPSTGRRCEVERVVAHLALQRRQFRETGGRIYALGFSFWKRAYVRPFIESPWNSVRFIRNVRQLDGFASDRDSKMLVWASRESAAVRATAKMRGTPIWRMEDGFIRSVGLGSDFQRPWSLVIDRLGIYFDPAAESDLERLLNEADFSAELIERAAMVRELICTHRITKYNVELDEALALPAQGRPIILVAGQVEDDASVVKGGAEIRTNTALLRAVREANPDAFVIYKPHPDVLARNRPGGVMVNAVSPWCDHVERRHSILRCIEAAQEVHTMTSLAGFDALLRGKRVTTYGMPFYAGWGLTRDHAVVARRRRHLSLDELVAGALLVYPRYWDADIQAYVELEQVLQKIIERTPARRGRFRGLTKWLTYLHAVYLSCRYQTR